jgi:hypothetical protein
VAYPAPHAVYPARHVACRLHASYVTYSARFASYPSPPVASLHARSESYSADHLAAWFTLQPTDTRSLSCSSYSQSDIMSCSFYANPISCAAYPAYLADYRAHLLTILLFLQPILLNLILVLFSCR